MRIFTLGKKGIPLFLFSLILFSGTFTAQAQETCPAVAETSQVFCDSQEAEVGDLLPEQDVTWYADEGLTQELAETVLLENNTLYYGSADGICPSVVVRTTINIMPEILGVKASNTFASFSVKQSLSNVGLCVADIDNPGVFVRDLNTSATSPVQWYFGTSSATAVAVAADDELQNGTYWVEALIMDGSGNVICRTNRSRTIVTLDSEPAPTGPTTQTFCELDSPVLSNIEVDGEVAFYPSSTSTTRLSQNTEIPLGTTIYYLSSFGDVCESSDRLAVTVTVTPATIISDPQEFCQSVDTAGGPGRTVDELAPDGASWFADATLDTAVPSGTELQNGTSYFTRLDSTTCEVTEVEVTLFDPPNAGINSGETFCQNQGQLDLIDFILPSDTLGDPDTNGTVNNDNFNGTLFNPADFEPGTYTLTYTVPAIGPCPSNSSEFTMVILEAPNAGNDITETVCSSIFDDPQALETQFAVYMAGRDLTGTFDDQMTPTVETATAEEMGQALFIQYNLGRRVFPLTYTVADANCPDSAQINITVIDAPNAGDGGSIQLVKDTTNTTTLEQANANAPAGGVWTDADGNVVSGTFAPQEPGTYTYTVTGDGGCAGTATVSVLAAPQGCPEVTETTQRFCENIDTERPTVASLGPDNAVWYATATSTEALPSTTILEEGVEYFAGTSDGSCTERTGVTVVFFDTPNAGKTTDLDFCLGGSAVNLVDYINPSPLGPAQQGGTFSPALENNEFDPAEFGPGNYTFKYIIEGNDDCPTDEAIIRVTVLDPNAGENGTIELVDGSTNDTSLEDALNGTPDAGGAWTDEDGNSVAGTLVPQEPGVFTYTVTEGECTVIATVTVTSETITEPTCPEVVTTEQFFCESTNTDTPLILNLEPTGATWYASADATEALDPNTPLVDGTSYFAGNADGSCTSRPSVLVTFTSVPAAPVAAPLSFCASEGATVANLTADGDNLLWYTDATLETLADETDVLVTGTYYVTDTNDTGCQSEATAVEVSITDAAAPTIAAGGNVFCEFDDPTISDLQDNITSTGSITWYNTATGGTAISTSQSLEHGVTYYAAATDASSACESSVRLPVTVDLGECPIEIPEAFSPNGDKINDTFKVDYLSEEFPNFTIEIYNRWGNVVFKGNTHNPEWDGVSTESRSFGDDVVPVGVYFYIVNFNDGQTAPIQGRLYLSR